MLMFLSLTSHLGCSCQTLNFQLQQIFKRALRVINLFSPERSRFLQVNRCSSLATLSLISCQMFGRSRYIVSTSQKHSLDTPDHVNQVDRPTFPSDYIGKKKVLFRQLRPNMLHFGTYPRSDASLITIILTALSLG